MRVLVAILVLALTAAPLAIQPAKWVIVTSALALSLCAAGVVARLAPVFTAGIAFALAAYALALSLADAEPRLGSAIVIGVIAALALETADFERRFRHVAIERAVLAAQVRYWGGVGILCGAGALVALAAALVVTTVLPLPSPSVLAALGAATTVAAAAAGLRVAARRARSQP
jgi:hypothetical protein